MKRVVLAVVFVLVARSAIADTIQITSGNLMLFSDVQGPWVSVSMQGNDFSGSIGGNALTSVSFAPVSQCWYICGPTTTTIGVGGTFLGGSGVAAGFAYQGTSYLVLFNNLNSLFVQLSGPSFVVPQSLPSQVGEEVTLHSTFTLTGLFNGALTPSGPFVHGDLIGQGIASITLRITEFPGLPGGPYFVVRGANYDFQDPAAVPEPTSLLLIGAGLAGIWRRRVRH